MLKSIMKFLKDLVRSPVDPEKASHTKFWSNIGLASMTAVFLYWGFKGTLTEWYMWVYAPTVAAPQLISKLISLRWGVTEAQREEQKSDQ
ncbi:membrane protein [Escherichia phage 4MG]|uniref:Putative membrane protein n=1 Tax=Escherichia phage 4MG TaxID=1391428 RepID=V5KSB3_9CAUD|nr:hypothetical protein [Enterobacter asburiae]YP_008857256.1 membrane protein [Escherichia phage 4MG]AGZ17514.1 putative membrane protein [Escherichia phage 4MG]MBL5840838.1 hypothetical protein [Enterobacter asburiae]